MNTTLRRVTAADAAQWLDMVSTSGSRAAEALVDGIHDIPPALDEQGGCETWGIDFGGVLQGSFTLTLSVNEFARVTNVGHVLFRPESFENGAADALINGLKELIEDRRQTGVVTVPALDRNTVALLEENGFVCSGFQPARHGTENRYGAYYFTHLPIAASIARVPTLETLSTIVELAEPVLSRLEIARSPAGCDHIISYPFPLDLKVESVPAAEFAAHRRLAEAHPMEICGAESPSPGRNNANQSVTVRSILGRHDGDVVAGLSWFVDERDRAVRFTDGFVMDALSLGELVRTALRAVQEQGHALYTEIDIAVSATRLLKSAEYLGFVPVAFFPAACQAGEKRRDLVRMVKLNTGHHMEDVAFSDQTRLISSVVDRLLRDQADGVAVINLLRSLPSFEGLGDGELRKLSRLFSQKLVRANERIFQRGDSGTEAYIVMRGEVAICLDESKAPVAAVTTGQIFGELAFLDGAARNAHALASQPSILIVIQRSAFYELINREPHLGFIVMKNIAVELSHRLRKTNLALKSM